MKVKELMTEKVSTIGRDTTIRKAAQEMAMTNVGALPVTEDGKLLGMITDRDITIRVVGDGLDPERTAVKQVMTSGVFTITEDEDVGQAAHEMEEHQLRRAPVVDEKQHLIGIISLGDLAVKGGDTGLTGEVLKGISQPATARR